MSFSLPFLLSQVLVRMRQYKDDLLASCLQLLLSLPNELVECEFQALVPALQVGSQALVPALRVGQAFVPAFPVGSQAPYHPPPLPPYFN